MEKEKEFAIDIVYTWVNGNDPEWQKEKLFWQKKEGADGDSTNDCRFIDNEELKFSLRSVAINAPWIRKIFIVTNGQVPKWLDTSHPKIRIIKHEEIMPKDALPTFNSFAIETCIANIPDLSEYFLYANDDFFINKPVKPNFFFDKDGRPIIRLVEQNWTDEEIKTHYYQNNVSYSEQLIEKKYSKRYKHEDTHNIFPYRKSHFIKCIKEFENEFKNTCYKRFRSFNCVERCIVSLYSIVNKEGILKKYKKNNKLKKDCLHIGLWSPNSIKDTIEEYKPTLFCINDDEWTNPDNRERLKATLAGIFPKAQDWEIKTEFQIEPVFNNEKDTINIVFAPDNYFCKYFAVALQSLIDNSNKTKNYDIVLFESNISSRNKKLLLNMIPPNFSLRFYNLNEYMSETFEDIELKPKNNWSISMYYRIFIPCIMKKYSKVLYLDSDICVNKDISELFNIDFENKQILAVTDSISPVLFRDKNRQIYMIEVLNLKKPETYFNSGVIMFNNLSIDIEIYKEKIFKAFNIENTWYPDQDILNVIFEDKTKHIPCKWNYLYAEPVWGIHYLNQISGEYKRDFFEARKEPYIIHYCSPRKPWNMPSVEYSEIFWHYARKTPFYEEILYENTNQNLNKEIIKNVIYRHRIYLQYLRCKILKSVTSGNKKEHYKNKAQMLKNKVNSYRNILKS